MSSRPAINRPKFWLEICITRILAAHTQGEAYSIEGKILGAVDAGEVTADCAEAVLAAFTLSGIDLVNQIDELPEPGQIDRALLQQLCEGARRHLAAGAPCTRRALHKWFPEL